MSREEATGQSPERGDRKELHPRYEEARRLACEHDYSAARCVYQELANEGCDEHTQALVRNDLAVLDVLDGNVDSANAGFRDALESDEGCAPAHTNLALLQRALESQPVAGPGSAVHASAGERGINSPTSDPLRPTRVVFLSLLFNWPSTGGGTVHTVEACRFLAETGYNVHHIYARFPEWGVGQVDAPLDVSSETVDFDATTWNPDTIRHRMREAVDRFRPDSVIITASWNTKPLLAEAVQGYRYFIRLAALECVCPLNNVRLLVDDNGQVRQCQKNQLAQPEVCKRCVQNNGHHSGGLHQRERAIAGFEDEDYPVRLRRAFAEAEAVLAVNPLIAEMAGPYAKQSRVVPSGFDRSRFPWPWPSDRPLPERPAGKTVLFFAGLIDEYMKGFRVLHEACSLLWRKRQDFELVATGEPEGQIDEFTRFVGWLSQDELPLHLRAADALVFPTVAQEALGRSAVEAMGVGRPVIASRIGGLQFTVSDYGTGLLCKPGDVNDLASKIETLLDDPELRDRLGLAARRRFEDEFTWDRIIERHYIPLLGAPVRKA